MKHTRTGNCWAIAYECDDCRRENLCDVCHDHDMPRGECDECKPCKACEAKEKRDAGGER